MTKRERERRKRNTSKEKQEIRRDYGKKEENEPTEEKKLIG